VDQTHDYFLKSISQKFSNDLDEVFGKDIGLKLETLVGPSTSGKRVT
jgi:hypothetical protein